MTNQRCVSIKSYFDELVDRTYMPHAHGKLNRTSEFHQSFLLNYLILTVLPSVYFTEFLSL